MHFFVKHKNFVLFEDVQAGRAQCNVSKDYVWHYGPVWIDIQDTQRPRAAAAVFSGQLNHKQGGS